MQPEEFASVRTLQADVFGDPQIGDLLDALRESPSFVEELNFVADIDGELVAHVQYSIALLDAPSQLIDVLVLSPVGVRPEHQNRGIGSALVSQSLTSLSARPEPLVFLEGDPAFYGRFGFRPGGDLGFRKPSLRIPDPAFQVVALPSYDAATMTGTLVYPDVFWRTDSVGLR